MIGRRNGVTVLALLLAVTATARAQYGCAVNPGDKNLGVPFIFKGTTPQVTAAVGSASFMAVNVKDCGAKGDSVDDDSQALQNALNVCAQAVTGPTAGTGMAILLPPGTYSFATGIDVQAPCVFVGAPGNLTTLNYTGTGTAIVWEHATQGASRVQYSYGPGLRDLTLQGPGLTGSAVGLQVGNLSSRTAQGGWFENLKITNFATGLKFGNGAFLVTFTNFQSTGNVQDFLAPSGVTDAGEGDRFSDCTFSNTLNSSGASAPARSVAILGGYTITFLRCSFDNAQLYDSSSTHIVCVTCHFENPGGRANYHFIDFRLGSLDLFGTEFYQDSATASITDFMRDSGTVTFLRAYNTVFSGNISTNVANAFNLQACQHAAIMGSVIYTPNTTTEWQVGGQCHVEGFGGVNQANGTYGRMAMGRFCQPAYGTTVTINSAICNYFQIVATNGTGFTISTPSNTPFGITQLITVDVYNTSGGALGTVTWGGGYKLAGGAFTSPGTGNHRFVVFQYDEPSGNWHEVTRASADVAN